MRCCIFWNPHLFILYLLAVEICCILFYFLADRYSTFYMHRTRCSLSEKMLIFWTTLKFFVKYCCSPNTDVHDLPLSCCYDPRLTIGRVPNRLPRYYSIADRSSYMTGEYTQSNDKRIVAVEQRVLENIDSLSVCYSTYQKIWRTWS